MRGIGLGMRALLASLSSVFSGFRGDTMVDRLREKAGKLEGDPAKYKRKTREKQTSPSTLRQIVLERKRRGMLEKLFGGGRFDVMTRQRQRAEARREKWTAVNELFPKLLRGDRRNLWRNMSAEKLSDMLNAD